MTEVGRTYSKLFGALCLTFAVFVYLDNTDSEHAATNPDELLYLQIARLTADNGHWLPLQATQTKHRNTKPPGLFWQGIVTTDWAQQWELWRLRLPNALFSVLTAAMAFFIARKLAGTFSAGTIAALSYLAFLGVYRHCRVFLTSAPETFWLFLPFFVLLMLPPASISWGLSFAFGAIIGIGLLYKSFAMVVPSLAAIAWWSLHQREYKISEWLVRDAPKVALTGLLSLAVFGLWFALDPQRQLILADFVLKENVGKFDADEAGYVATALWGKHSIWQYTAGWLTNAGLLAPLVAAVFILAWRHRRQMSAPEQLLWIWIITLFVFHLLPNLRYERYLLPAMPAVAVLCALYWDCIPRWVQAISLVASLIASIVLLLGAVLLSGQLVGSEAYSAVHLIMLVAICAVCLAGLLRRDWTRPLAVPSVILVYLAYTIFLRPFDSSIGTFSADAVEAARGKQIILPAPFTARDEIYRFMLPSADLRRIKEKDLPDALADQNNTMFIVQASLDAPQQVSGFRTLGRRLNLRDYFSGEETTDMLRGNVAKHLFAWDLLIERDLSSTP